MTDKEQIERLVNEFIKGTNIFIVGVKVSSSNRITVLADTMKGITIDECAELSRHIEKNLDRSTGDFELQVSSPGLDMPFSVIEQYRKNEGKSIEVVDTEGSRFSGVLKNVTTGGFELVAEVKSKDRIKEIKELSFNFEQVKSAREVIIIK